MVQLILQALIVGLRLRWWGSSGSSLATALMTTITPTTTGKAEASRRNRVMRRTHTNPHPTDRRSRPDSSVLIPVKRES